MTTVENTIDVVPGSPNDVGDTRAQDDQPGTVPGSTLVTTLHPLKTMGEQELQNAVKLAWNEVFGTSATTSLLMLGQALSEYACRGTSKAKRFDRACDVVRSVSGGLFGNYEQRRIRFAIVAWHLSQQIADLKLLPVSYLTVVIESTGIGVDWKLVTDNSTAVQVERLKVVLPKLIDRTIGIIENRQGVQPKLSAWREVIKKVVVDGKAVQELIDDQQKTDVKPVPSSPGNQPTENQASASVADQQVNMTSVQSAPVAPADELTKDMRLAACMQFLSAECDLDEIITALVNHGHVELLQRLNDASNSAFDRLVASGTIKPVEQES